MPQHGNRKQISDANFLEHARGVGVIVLIDRKKTV
jgi:hypothetical protein